MSVRISADDENYADFGRYPLWAARYGGTEPALPPGWTTWTVWQYWGDANIPGIGKVDTDLFNGTYEQLVDFAKGRRR